MAGRQAISTLLWLSLAISASGPVAATDLTRAAAIRSSRWAENSIEITNKSRLALRNYPFQFGRPFLRGIIPAGECPVVLTNGTRLPTQADVKNRYPDGSVEYAVIAAVIHNVPVNGSVTLTFAPGLCNNTPLTKAQMLGDNFKFDAVVTMTGVAASQPAKLTSVPIAPTNQNNEAAWAAITNGGMRITINGHPCSVAGINFSHGSISRDGAAVAAALSACAGTTVSWSSPGNWVTVISPAQGAVSHARPPASGQDLSSFFGLQRAQGATVSAPVSANPVVNTVSARTMLQNGDFKLWTSGPIAQTIMLGDDSAAAKYDVGFGDGHHPVRPRFYATFWPTTDQVFVRVVGENDKTTEIEDAAYTLQISAPGYPGFNMNLTGGKNGTVDGSWTGLTAAAAEPANYTGSLPVNGTPAPRLVANGQQYSYLLNGGEILPIIWNANRNNLTIEGRASFGTTAQPITIGQKMTIGYPKTHYAFTAWTQRFWLGGTPNPEVDIDNNLAYVDSTRFFPNYDASISIPEATRASYYASFMAMPNKFMDGNYYFNKQGWWTPAMDAPGTEPFIAPYPQWSVMWMYTGDWRMRRIALAMADLAGAYPGQLRETDPSKRLGRGDPQGCNPCSGLGHTVSITDRQTLVTSVFGYSATTAADNVNFVGAVRQLTAGAPWDFEEAHQPAAFYPQYILTGDPWYLQEMYLWAGFTAARANGADTGDAAGRGPSGSYGGIDDQLRGAAWGIRNRAEVAFAAPDADPEKAYFTYLTNDALARWEGSFGITGTAYDGTAIKVWGARTGNYYTENGGPVSGKVPPLGNWESAGNPNGSDGSVQGNIKGGTFAASVGAFTTPWNHEYLAYALGRAAELGFAVNPLRVNTVSKFFTGIINSSGHPKLIGMYEIPSETNCTNSSGGCTAPPGGFYTSWSAAVAAIPQPFLTGKGWNPAGNDGDGALPAYFAGGLNHDGRPIYLMGGLAMMVDNGDPGAAQAWSWFVPNVYRAIPAGDLQFDPKWAIVPRTDANTLPAQPIATPSAANAT